MLLDPNAQERARKNESSILSALASIGQSTVAIALGVNESTISKRKSGGDFKDIAEFLAALGLKAVPVTMKCYRPDDIEPYIQLAKQHMRKVTSVHDLLDDDPE